MKVRNVLKTNIKDSKTIEVVMLPLLLTFDIYHTPFSSASIVDFEQVYVYWVMLLNQLFTGFYIIAALKTLRNSMENIYKNELHHEYFTYIYNSHISEHLRAQLLMRHSKYLWTIIKQKITRNILSHVFLRISRKFQKC